MINFFHSHRIVENLHILKNFWFYDREKIVKLFMHINGIN